MSLRYRLNPSAEGLIEVIACLRAASGLPGYGWMTANWFFARCAASRRRTAILSSACFRREMS